MIAKSKKSEMMEVAAQLKLLWAKPESLVETPLARNMLFNLATRLEEASDMNELAEVLRSLGHDEASIKRITRT